MLCVTVAPRDQTNVYCGKSHKRAAAGKLHAGFGPILADDEVTRHSVTILRSKSGIRNGMEWNT